ncbi:hypothetical protein NHP164001_18210 [Helicobacter trogontum]|uniref:Uncharacterized protein n=1 Tax=Helicobacter trogontum TaxID=50960 RepID=A0ABQ0D6M4_9HELI
MGYNYFLDSIKNRAMFYCTPFDIFFAIALQRHFIKIISCNTITKLQKFKNKNEKPKGLE